MNKFNISILCAVFLLSAAGANVCAQTLDEGEIYYSNPREGIKPTAPKPYSDNEVASKSDDITVELTGEVKDTTPKTDTTKIRLKSIGEYSRRDNPYYWGTSIIYSWDPWYSPYYNGWYYPGWGGSHWMLTYGWGIGPYWSFGLGWNWGWGTPWWYWDPFWYPGYYGHYGYGGYAYNWHGGNRYGHSYLGGGRSTAKGLATGAKGRSSGLQSGRTVRRGGVDLNNGGRATRGNISGTGTRGVRNAVSGTQGTAGNRYAKPASVAANRNGERRAENGERRTANAGQRAVDRSSSTSSRFESGRTTSTSTRQSTTRSSNNTFRTNTSSSTFNSGRSSSSSRSSSSFSGSSSRGSGSFSGGASRSRR